MRNYYNLFKNLSVFRRSWWQNFEQHVLLGVFFFTSFIANAQLLINPAAEGGFENGSTFAANGWTVANATTNQWATSSVPGWFTGARGAHVTNNTATNAWLYSSGSTSRSHFYRDVAFPTGIGSATLTFDWRGNGNDGDFDNLLVYVTNTTITPSTSSPTGTNTTTAGWTGYADGTTGYFLLQRNGTASPTATTAISYSFTPAQVAYLSGNTRRLIFVWKNDGSGGSNPPASLDNISLSVSSCYPPNAPVVSSSTATSANFAWTVPTTAPASGYEWEVRFSGAAGSGATGLASSGSNAAGVLTASTSSLLANTSYILYVRSNCGAGDFSSWVASSFTTPLSCFPATAVSGTATSPTSANLSWTAPTTAPSTGYQWEVRTTGAGGSGATGLADSGSTAAGIVTASSSLLAVNTTYRLYVRSNCGAGDFSTWAQSSTFTTPLSCFPATAVSGTATTPTSANLSWTAPTTAPSTGYQWEVRTTGAAGSGATGLVDSGSTAAGIVTASSSLLAANTTYRLYVRSNCGAGDFSTWAQSSTFTTPLSCFPATAVSGTATTPTSANLSWTAPTTTPSTGYQWEVRTTGAGGSGATGLVDSGSTAAGIVTASSSLLAANTTYRLYVRSNCGASDFSTWAQSATFRTPCVSTAFPVPIEGFNATGLPACWSASAITNTWSGFIGGSGDISGPYSGSGFMEKNYLTSNALLISMPIDLTSVTTQARINMFMHRHASADVNDQYIVYVNTVPSLTGATQLLSLYSKTTIAPTVAATGWHQNFINIPTSFNSSTNVYVIVEGKTAGGFTSYDLGIDDFSVENVPADLPDFVSLHSPANSAIQIGTGTVINAQVFETGLTDVEPGLSGQATGIVGAIGISPIGSNTNPNTWTTWVPATYDALVTGANDGYKATIGAGLASGTYYYAARFSLNGGAFVYGGINSSNVGGIWDGATFVSGVLTVNALTNDDCSGAIALAIGTQLTTSNVSATKSADTTPSCGELNFTTNGKDVWYSVVVPPNVSRLDIETNNNADAAFTDSAIQAYRGVCGSLVSIECDDDDSTDGSFSLLNLTALTPGETIYVRVWGYNGISGSFKIKASVSACGIETRWNGTAWSNGTPVTGIRAVIAGDYNGPGFTACAMDVIGTSQVTFTSGSNVTLNGLLNVASTAAMTLESNANLVQTVAGTNVGNVTVKRESAQLVRLDHTLWSSPVTGQKLFAFSPNTLTNRFYVYNTPTNTYVTTGLSATTDFVVGKGYGIRAANNHPETPTTWMGSFAGNPNNGDKSFTLALTGTGFNLVGNPYPSVIDAAAFVTANSARINGTLYFYAHTLTMSATGTFPAGTNYALWNATGQTAATLGTSGVPALVPNGKVQVGQGFLVKATAAGSANFTNAMREASNGNQFFRSASETNTSDTEKHRLWLNLTNAEGTAFNQMLVGYINGATQEVDNLYDGLSFGNEGSALSSRLMDQDYTIQGRALPFNEEDIVPLGFKAVTPGNYTISLADMDGVFAGTQDVFLKDYANGSVNNIKIAPYSFVSNAGTFNDRFEIVYRSTLSTPESTFNSSAVIAFVKNSQLNIETKGNEMKSVSVFDVRGRLLFQQSGINNASFIVQGFTPQNQVILVQVTSANNEVATIKVIF